MDLLEFNTRRFYKVEDLYLILIHLCNSLQDEMFQKFNFDTEWAVRLISRITNDEDIPIEGDAIVKQVKVSLVD